MPIQMGVEPSTWQASDWLSPGEEATTAAVYCPAPNQCDTLADRAGIFTLTLPPPSGVGTLQLTVNNEVRVVCVVEGGSEEFVHLACRQSAFAKFLCGHRWGLDRMDTQACFGVRPPWSASMHLRRCFAQEPISLPVGDGNMATDPPTQTPCPMAWVDGIPWFAFPLQSRRACSRCPRQQRVLQNGSRRGSCRDGGQHLGSSRIPMAAITLPVAIQDFPAGRTPHSSMGSK